LIDLHSHILPGLDDGPPSLDGSRDLALAAVAAGTRKMVATPHVGPPHGVDPAEIEPATSLLREHLAERRIPLVVLPGAEITAERAGQLDEGILARLGLGGSRWLLIEPPFTGPVALEPLVLQLQAGGFGVVLAHPERCAALRLDPAQLDRLLRLGVLTSVTAASLSGRFGGRVQDFALTLLERGWVHNVASDAHDALRRPPGLDEGLAAAGRKLQGVRDLRAYLVQELPAALLSDEALPPPPAAPTRRRRWRLPRR
jgi:protein-tyrosine phosphatase